MTIAERGRHAQRAAWGWGVLVTLCPLLIINAAWLFFGVGTPSVFEADTGVPASEFRAAYPTVADALDSRGRTIAILLGGLGMLALTVSLAGMRRRAAWAGNALWVFVLALLAVATNAFAGARPDIGSFYLVWAVVAATALVLTRLGDVRRATAQTPEPRGESPAGDARPPSGG